MEADEQVSLAKWFAERAIRQAKRGEALNAVIRTSGRIDSFRSKACLATLIGSFWVVYREGLTGLLMFKIAVVVGSVWFIMLVLHNEWSRRRLAQLDRDFPPIDPLEK